MTVKISIHSSTQELTFFITDFWHMYCNFNSQLHAGADDLLSERLTWQKNFNSQFHAGAD